MKSNILVATMACAALAVTAPALAKPGGGKGHGNASVVGKGKARGNGVLVAPRTNIRTTRGPNYGVNVCPPGLAAKLNGCLPPGQARKIFDLGQRIPRGYGFYTPFNDIPLAYRNQIPPVYPDRDFDYIYRGNTIYVVDPATRLVSDIIALAL